MTETYRYRVRLNGGAWRYIWARYDGEARERFAIQEARGARVEIEMWDDDFRVWIPLDLK